MNINDLIDFVKGPVVNDDGWLDVKELVFYDDAHWIYYKTPTDIGYGPIEVKFFRPYASLATHFKSCPIEDLPVKWEGQQHEH